MANKTDNFYQNDERIWKQEGVAQDPKHMTSSVKHGGVVGRYGCHLNGFSYLIADWTINKISRVLNSGVILSVQIAPSSFDNIPDGMLYI